MEDMFGHLLYVIWSAESVTVEMVLPEDGVDERRNASDY